MIIGKPPDMTLVMLFCSNVLWVWVRRSDEMIDAWGSLLLTLGFYVLCPLLISAQENLNAINTTHKVKQIPRNTIKFFNGWSHTGANTLSPCTVFSCLFWPTRHAHKITSFYIKRTRGSTNLRDPPLWLFAYFEYAAKQDQPLINSIAFLKTCLAL